VVDVLTSWDPPWIPTPKLTKMRLEAGVAWAVALLGIAIAAARASAPTKVLLIELVSSRKK
jgi:hypothetical protein